MLYIYNCFGGTHSSSLASAVHLKKLPLDRVPSREEILNVDYFNQLTYKDMGRLIYRGTDEEGNKVFTVGRGTSKAMVPCMQSLIALLQNEYDLKEKVILSNMSPVVPPAMTLGGFFSRGLKLHFIGVPLLVIGAKQAFGKVIEFVDRTKEAAKTSKEQLVVLKNDEQVRA